MSEFTKGPWTIRVTGYHWNSADLRNIEINFGDDQECICDTVYRMEDANLIAAAPDMLEALDYFLDSLGDKHTIPSECIGKIIKAIKKAKGE